jgi:hypothetical protein
MHWEENPDIEEIQIGLSRGDHYEIQYRELLYQASPILQEPPDDLDETWRHGILLNGGSVGGYLELARSYKQSAEALLEAALESGEPLDWGFPVLFAYRHSLELYLKIIGRMEEFEHSLRKCVWQIEKRYRRRIGSPVREWIIEFDKIDPKSTAFRYADDQAATLRGAEFWVDFVHLKFAMNRVFRILDDAICWETVRGSP